MAMVEWIRNDDYIVFFLFFFFFFLSAYIIFLSVFALWFGRDKSTMTLWWPEKRRIHPFPFLSFYYILFFCSVLYCSVSVPFFSFTLFILFTVCFRFSLIKQRIPTIMVLHVCVGLVIIIAARLFIFLLLISIQFDHLARNVRTLAHCHLYESQIQLNGKSFVQMSNEREGRMLKEKEKKWYHLVSKNKIWVLKKREKKIKT